MIPIYRAKKIDSDSLVEGYYFPQDYIGNYPNEDAEEREEIVKHFICGTTTHDIWDDEEGHFKFMGIDEIDPTTLAIHFPDMLDSQGNKIFASLSEDGKGGDICYVRDFSYGDLQGVARYEDNHFRIHRKGKAMGISLKCRDFKIIGIQE